MENKETAFKTKPLSNIGRQKKYSEVMTKTHMHHILPEKEPKSIPE